MDREALIMLVALAAFVFSTFGAVLYLGADALTELLFL
jgi:hypothetical protein